MFRVTNSSKGRGEGAPSKPRPDNRLAGCAAWAGDDKPPGFSERREPLHAALRIIDRQTRYEDLNG